MNERPIRLTVTDDLARGRASVFFRLLLAIPLFLWLALWTIAAIPIAIVNWAATLLLGRSPAPLHRFLATYVTYTTHVYAYTNLAAEPYPSFGGEPGYPIDLTIDPPRPQNRWITGFRVLLALPALLIATVLFGSSFGSYMPNFAESDFGAISLLAAAAFLSWFVGVALGRSQRGLRDAIAYGLSYGAQLWAYLLLLTDRYPSSNPLDALPELPFRSDPIRLEISDDLRRSRLTVFFRLLLAIPYWVWLALWGIATIPVVIANWISVLFIGRSPQPLHRFLAAYLRYQVHVTAFVCLIGDPLPHFGGTAGAYPVDLHVAEPCTQGRWTALFRLPVAVPALLLASVYQLLAVVAAFLGWFAALVTGNMPVGLRNAAALGLRYTAQTNGYLLLLTSTYPYSGPCEEGPPAPLAPAPVEPSALAV
jgi:hypothetical protein